MDDQREELAKLGLITLNGKPAASEAHIGEADKKIYQEITELLNHIRTEYHLRFGMEALQNMQWNYAGVSLYKRLVSGLAG